MADQEKAAEPVNALNEKGANIGEIIGDVQEVIAIINLVKSADTNTNGQSDVQDIIAIGKSMYTDWLGILGKATQIKTIAGGDVAAVKAALAKKK
jgi:hypothetical protein